MGKGPGTGPTVRRRSFLRAGALLGTASAAGCTQTSAPSETPTTTKETTELAGTVLVAGSSTVYPLTLRVGERFTERHPNASVSVASTGTGGGFSDFFCLGKTDLNDASRPVSDDERPLCAENGVEFLRFQVATDAVTVIVNNEADWVDCVTPNELAGIWRRGGAETWSDVRPDWPDVPIDLYGPTSDSGTFDYFAEEIIGSIEEHRQDYVGTEQDSTIVTHVKQSLHAIGYLGFAYFKQNKRAVKALGITEGGNCVHPSLSTAKSGSYTPLSRPLFIYVSKASLATPTTRAFLRYYLDAVDTDLVSDVGYVPLDEETAAANRLRLEEVLSS